MTQYSATKMCALVLIGLAITFLAMPRAWLADAAGQGRAPALRMTISPKVAVAPAAVRIHAFVEPNEANRALTVTLESDEDYHSGTQEVAGASAPRMFVFQFRSLGSGDYNVRATLSGSADVVRAVLQESLIVR